jgi:hypothetical protein
MAFFNFDQAIEARSGGVDVVEVISTSFQTGAEYVTIRAWDGTPSAIGSLQPRDGRADGKVLAQKGVYSPHRGS